MVTRISKLLRAMTPAVRRALLAASATLLMGICALTVWVQLGGMGFAPAPVTNLAASANQTTAIITWDSTQTRTQSYDVELDEDGTFTSPQTIEVSDTMAMIPGLSPGETYFVRVRPSSTADSVAVATSFSTMPNRYTVATPTVDLDKVTSSSITATWKTMVADSMKFQVQLSKSKDMEDPTTSTVSSPKHTFAKLTNKTSYYVRVRALDAEGHAASAWSEVKKATTPNEAPLVVGTFNVGCYSCANSRLPAWEKRRDAVADRINTEAPDVLGIEELSSTRVKGSRIPQVSDLMNRLDSKYAIIACGSTRKSSPCTNSREVHIVYNKEALELLQTGSGLLPGAGKKHWAWATFKQKSTGKTFLFSSAHLVVGSKNASARKRQAQHIVSQLREHGLGDLPTIVVGDFNSNRHASDGNQPYRVMAAAGLLDPLGQGAGQKNIVENRIRTNYNSYNWYSRSPKRSGTHVDYIFVSPMRVSEYEVVVSLSNGRVAGTIPSDHNMLKSTVWLP